MAIKRKAAGEARRQLKRVHLSSTSDDNYGIFDDVEQLSSSYSSPLSDAEESGNDSDPQPTPVTPFSPVSSKYPSDLKTHLCPYEDCSKAFNRPARLTEHIRSHKNERIFNCAYADCEKSFLRASHLNHHVKSAHTLIRDYVCDREGCGKAFATGSRLRRHYAAHEGRDKYRCTEHPPCVETFRKHSTLQKHITMVHLNQKPFPCLNSDTLTGKKCTQAFDTAGHLRAHERRIHEGDRFTCTECLNVSGDQEMGGELENNGEASSFRFSTYALLQAHMRTVHPPTCPNCTLTCSSTRELRQHIEISHGDISLEERRTHPCTHLGCSRSFTKKGNLNVHVRTVHNGEKRFVCGETDLSTSKRLDGWIDQEGCGRRYGSKLALEEHVRTAHLGFRNARTERKAQLKGDDDKSAPNKTGIPSHLTLLTGEGYERESARHIPCLLVGCAHRFKRDYDLWLHMGATHGLESNDTQLLFMQRAMQGGDQSFDLSCDTPLIPQTDSSLKPPSSGDDGHSGLVSHDTDIIALIDPLLTSTAGLSVNPL
ncbi:Strongly-conserved Zn-finger binding protein (TFIIIA) [Myotisia sp. PD_48]|nr:Strongly-conserved Zn-finger binding protein (TFIIIA) [Myotisia sp. PD_48]